MSKSATSSGRRSRAPRFADRREAGRLLSLRLAELALEQPVVLALPRGGVPVAAEIAADLGAALDVLAVRKLGAPQNPELGIGAVAEDGSVVIDSTAVTLLGIDEAALTAILGREVAELRRRVELYRGGRELPDLRGRTAIVVDDGVATGATDAAALRAVRRMSPATIVLAVPVCSPEAADRLAQEADEVVCLRRPASLDGVGRWYEDFSQVSDEEVLRLLNDAARRAVDEHAPAENG